MNDILENALKETWEKKDKFYEENKNFSALEILVKLENKYCGVGASHNRTVTAEKLLTQQFQEPIRQLGLRND